MVVWSLLVTTNEPYNGKVEKGPVYLYTGKNFCYDTNVMFRQSGYEICINI